MIEARGEASYRTPIVVPPGPGGHQPDLALAYNSGEGKGPAGWLGFGWGVAGESRIERETRTGSPYDFANLTCGTGAVYPCYRSAYVLDGQDLICSSGTCSMCATGTPCRYRTQSDDGRIINFKGDTSGWEIKDRDGRALVYGAASAGRLVNPANGIGQVFSWQLESSTDVSGNVVSYIYDTTSSPNVAYLKKILYGQGETGNRSVEFILNNTGSAPRPDQPVSAKAGFRQQTDRRVTSIEVRAASNALVTRYDLTYSQDPDSLRSQLASVQRKGSDGTASLPPYTFDYSFRPATRGLFATSESSFNASATSCWPDGGLIGVLSPNGVLQIIADMNRDGLGDLYQVTNTNSGSPGIVGVALGTGTSFRPRSGQNCSSYSAFGLGTQWSTQKLLFLASTVGSYETIVGSTVLDFDGDGYLDHYFVYGYPYNPVPLYLRRGSAGGFIEPPLNTAFQLDGAYAFPYPRWAKVGGSGNLDTRSAMADVTGDGRPDLVVTELAKNDYITATGYDWTVGGSWTGWSVYVNRGLKTDANGTYLDFPLSPMRWAAPLNALIQNDYQGMISTVILADQNGDGLADRLTSNTVSYGYGAGFYAQETVPFVFNSIGVNTDCTVSGTYDLNGDGLLDYITAVGTTDTNPNWRVQFGTGHGFSSEVKLFPSDGDSITPDCVEGNGRGRRSRRFAT